MSGGRRVECRMVKMREGRGTATGCGASWGKNRVERRLLWRWAASAGVVLSERVWSAWPECRQKERDGPKGVVS